MQVKWGNALKFETSAAKRYTITERIKRRKLKWVIIGLGETFCVVQGVRHLTFQVSLLTPNRALQLAATCNSENLRIKLYGGGIGNWKYGDFDEHKRDFHQRWRTTFLRLLRLRLLPAFVVAHSLAPPFFPVLVSKKRGSTGELARRHS